MINSPRKMWFGGLSFVLVFALSQSANAAIIIGLSSDGTDLSQLVIGNTFTVDIVIRTTAPEATGLVMSADGGSGLTATGNYVAPASIFNFAPSVPFGGIANTPAVLGLQGDGKVKLFEGASLSAAAGDGPDSLSVEFTATSIGSGTIRVGIPGEDSYSGGDNVYNYATLDYNVGGGGSTDTAVANPVPEPATIAVWSVLGLCGVGYGVRRKRKKA